MACPGLPGAAGQGVTVTEPVAFPEHRGKKKKTKNGDQKVLAFGPKNVSLSMAETSFLWLARRCTTRRMSDAMCYMLYGVVCV